jgi:hypothetical protein
METFLLDGKWKAEDDPSPGSPIKLTLLQGSMMGDTQI